MLKCGLSIAWPSDFKGENKFYFNLLILYVHSKIKKQKQKPALMSHRGHVSRQDLFPGAVLSLWQLRECLNLVKKLQELWKGLPWECRGHIAGRPGMGFTLCSPFPLAEGLRVSFAALTENTLLSVFLSYGKRAWGCWALFRAPGAEWGWVEVGQDWFHCRGGSLGVTWASRLANILGSGRKWHRGRAARTKNGKWEQKVLKRYSTGLCLCACGGSYWTS